MTDHSVGPSIIDKIIASSGNAITGEALGLPLEHLAWNQEAWESPCYGFNIPQKTFNHYWKKIGVPYFYEHKPYFLLSHAKLALKDFDLCNSEIVGDKRPMNSKKDNKLLSSYVSSEEHPLRIHNSDDITMATIQLKFLLNNIDSLESEFQPDLLKFKLLNLYRLSRFYSSSVGQSGVQNFLPTNEIFMDSWNLLEKIPGAATQAVLLKFSAVLAGSEIEIEDRYENPFQLADGKDAQFQNFIDSDSYKEDFIDCEQRVANSGSGLLMMLPLVLPFFSYNEQLFFNIASASFGCFSSNPQAEICVNAYCDLLFKMIHSKENDNKEVFFEEMENYVKERVNPGSSFLAPNRKKTTMKSFHEKPEYINQPIEKRPIAQDYEEKNGRNAAVSEWSNDVLYAGYHWAHFINDGKIVGLRLAKLIEDQEITTCNDLFDAICNTENSISKIHWGMTSSYTGGTVQTVLPWLGYVFFACQKNPKLWKVLSTYGGHDTDTVANIVGGLMGIAFGMGSAEADEFNLKKEPVEGPDNYNYKESLAMVEGFAETSLPLIQKGLANFVKKADTINNEEASNIAEKVINDIFFNPTNNQLSNPEKEQFNQNQEHDISLEDPNLGKLSDDNDIIFLTNIHIPLIENDDISDDISIELIKTIANQLIENDDISDAYNYKKKRIQILM